MLELVTPAFVNNTTLLKFLNNLHTYIYNNLAKEQLWVSSMPCLIAKDTKIEVAKFGSSNKAQLKEIYRKGLSIRYGDKMQLISGVHFNYSFHPKLFDFLPYQKKDDYLLGVARNFLRYQWLILYLFGASPILNEDLVLYNVTEREKKNLDDATSLRTLCYANKKQFKISYNDLDKYCLDLKNITNKIDLDYQKIGIKKGKEFLQLNANSIQIENEFYSAIRPKPKAVDNERPLLSLQKNGINYFEIRCLDLQHDNPIGIHDSQIYFLELFMLFCFILPSPLFNSKELEEIENNKKAVCLRGRKEGLLLSNQGEKQTFLAWSNTIFACLNEIANWLQSPKLTQALAEQQTLILDSSKTPSARILAGMKKSKISFQSYILKKSQEQQSYFLNQTTASKFKDKMETENKQSLLKLAKIEKTEKVDFESFFKKYFQI